MKFRVRNKESAGQTVTVSDPINMRLKSGLLVKDSFVCYDYVIRLQLFNDLMSLLDSKGLKWPSGEWQIFSGHHLVCSVAY